ncbi:unnamed protein product, partial [Prorocentrum cordatum]
QRREPPAPGAGRGRAVAARPRGLAGQRLARLPAARRHALGRRRADAAPGLARRPRRRGP